MQTFVDNTFDIGPLRFGYSHDLVELPEGKPYLERWILWLGITLRIHKFWRGDDDRAPHDHPWAFITIPLNRNYTERVFEFYAFEDHRKYFWRKREAAVRRWRPHFRPSTHKHIVVMPRNAPPVWTFVVTGLRKQPWGFWPAPDTWISWRKWPASKAQENRPW